MNWRAVVVSGFHGVCLLSGLALCAGVLGIAVGYGLTVGARLAGVH